MPVPHSTCKIQHSIELVICPDDSDKVVNQFIPFALHRHVLSNQSTKIVSGLVVHEVVTHSRPSYLGVFMKKNRNVVL